MDDTAKRAARAIAEAPLGEAGQGAVAGFKIGRASAVMQTYIGIDRPCAAHIHEIDIERLGTVRFRYGRA